MKSASLDILYVGLERHIRLIKSYTEVDGIDFIIKSCRLKPYSYVYEKKDSRLFLYRKWFDEFGNMLQINNDKSISITYGDLALKKKKIICTDLYAGLSLKSVAKISKLVHICHGTNEAPKKFAFLTFCGIDNYLRCYLRSHHEWQQVSPLLLGLNNLLFIADHRDIEYFMYQENTESSPIPCISAQQWLTKLPSGQSFLTSIHRQDEDLSNILRSPCQESRHLHGGGG
jgi:hypothetical protein